jgi:A/G-specific adenine glycosylase
MRRNAGASDSLPVWLDDAASRRRFARRLLAWFGRQARDLPWRGTRDPYPIWVSEVMLQQTQVATVVPYFQRFLEWFPTVRVLAAASEHDVLRAWEGLGYYRRARQLHQAAQRIVSEHGGEFPRNADAIRRLPGIGRYTAGAILSIAMDAREAILEANTLRLWSRLLAYRGDPRKGAGQRVLWAAARQALPRRGVGAFNQALMELGAEVCRARQPACQACPVAEFCEACRLRVQHKVPVAAHRPAIESVREAVVIVRREGRVLVVQRGDGARWAGMWDFPRFVVPHTVAADAAAQRRHLRRQLRMHHGLRVNKIDRRATLRHSVTRFRITLDCYEATHAATIAQASSSPGRPVERWVTPASLETYALSVTGRKLARLIV